MFSRQGFISRGLTAVRLYLENYRFLSALTVYVFHVGYFHLVPTFTISLLEMFASIVECSLASGQGWGGP